MKKLLVLGLLGLTSLFADYKLVLTDVDGNQTEQCVKSYSFSNNLESIARQKGVASDIYSDEEVMTNKVYLGKPVYRKIVDFPKNTIGDNIWHEAKYDNPPKNVDTLIYSRITGDSLNTYSAISKYTNYDFRMIIRATGIGYYFGSIANKEHDFKNKKIILEYTKTTDKADTSPNKFKSYLIYSLSSSLDDTVIVKDMKNLGVQLLENYTYDASTDSCTPVPN